MDLPADLRRALSGELAAVPQKHLATAVARLSARYRTASPLAHGGFLRAPTDVLAYVAYRMPATFAAMHAALDEVRARQPLWRPRTFLDAGAGPGTGMWAAGEIWPELQRFTLLEREEGMISLGRRLAAHTRSAALRRADWRRLDLSSSWDEVPHDLVIASYVLGELSPALQERLLARLWSLTLGALVIIEPGTPAGFAHILRGRQHLLRAGATIVAPCPHMQPCPLASNDWCHFAQRLTRSRLHRQAKQADMQFEDEKFSYVAVARSPGLPIAGRVIRHPQIREGHIHLELCAPDGLKSTTVSRKDRAAMRQARALNWGDALSGDG
jgi:ribosomal protein RSM22 (predicted rRNA methylase)